MVGKNMGYSLGEIEQWKKIRGTLFKVPEDTKYTKLGGTSTHIYFFREI